MARKDRLEIETFDDDANAMRHWPEIQSRWRVAVNFIIVALSLLAPIQMTNWLFRRIGVTVEKGVSTAPLVGVDIFHPELIRIGKNTTIGLRTAILAHEITQDEFRIGPVNIGENVLIGTNCTVLPGVTIGDNATIAAHTFVNRDVPAGAFFGGVPAERLEAPE